MMTLHATSKTILDLELLLNFQIVKGGICPQVKPNSPRKIFSSFTLITYFIQESALQSSKILSA